MRELRTSGSVRGGMSNPPRLPDKLYNSCHLRKGKMHNGLIIGHIVCQGLQEMERDLSK